jgi:hypothetical protein
MSVTKGVKEGLKFLGKHMQDLTKPKTSKQKSTEKATKGQRTYREGQRKGTAIGAGAGAGTAAALSSEAQKGKESKAPTKSSGSKKADTRAEPKDYPTYQKGTPSSKAFKEAFAKAKDDGKKSFTFEGRSYKVEEKEPKKMMLGGMTKKYNKGGMGTAANCGASMKPSGGSRKK